MAADSGRDLGGDALDCRGKCPVVVLSNGLVDLALREVAVPHGEALEVAAPCFPCKAQSDERFNLFRVCYVNILAICFHSPIKKSFGERSSVR